MTPREYFTLVGKLTKCPNPAHNFQWGRLIGSWQWASDYWNTLTDDGTLQNNYIRIGTAEDQTDLKIYVLIVWKFALIFGFIPKKGKHVDR